MRSFGMFVLVVVLLCLEEQRGRLLYLVEQPRATGPSRDRSSRAVPLRLRSLFVRLGMPEFSAVVPTSTGSSVLTPC